jgi:hypothetical protein
VGAGGRAVAGGVLGVTALGVGGPAIHSPSKAVPREAGIVTTTEIPTTGHGLDSTTGSAVNGSATTQRRSPSEVGSDDSSSSSSSSTRPRLVTTTTGPTTVDTTDDQPEFGPFPRPTLPFP